MGTSVIIAAAGNGLRMNGIDKILSKINEKEIIRYSLEAFAKAECVEHIVVVTSEDKINAIKEIAKEIKSKVEIDVVLGAETRQKSVKNGLDKCKDSDFVMIHDGARPMITAELIQKLYTALLEKECAALGVPLKDTVKIIDQNGKITQTPDRKTLFAAQTPQGFDMKIYKQATKRAIEQNRDYTDDCQLVEAMGESVYMIEASYENLKITTPEDISIAENILKERNNA